MESIFLKILNMSLTSGWLILAVMLVRLVLKNMPKSMRCLLWALVAIRLLCPFSIESTLSLIPSTEPLASDIMYEARPEINSGIGVIDDAVNPVFTESFTPNPSASANPLQIWIFLAAYIWIMGIGILTLYVVVSCWRICRKVRVSLSLEEGIWVCDYIDTPFILGIFRPGIYVPSSMEQKNLAYVIAHEKAHLKRHDHLWKPVGFLLLMIYWFHPLIWAAYILFCRDLELACDEAVIREMSVQEKKAYSEALLMSSTSRHLIVACPLAFGEVGVKQRIRSILNYKKPAFWMILVTFVICVLVGVCFMTNPREEEDRDIFGARYSLAEMLYNAPQYSFVYRLENAPEYTLTAEHILMERGGIQSGEAWTDVGGLKEVSYSRRELYDFFEPLNNTAQEHLDEMERYWRADVYDESDSFYLVMQDEKGELFLAVGHGNDHVRWLWKLQKESGTYDYADLQQKIEGMGGQSTQIFALYEVDNIPSHLLVGYQADGDLGLATFVYDDTKEEYVIKARRNFGGASLYSMTIQQEAKLNQSITVALSCREDLAEVVADIGSGQMISKGSGRCPALIVFEWGEILPEDTKVDVRFYNAASEELERVDGDNLLDTEHSIGLQQDSDEEGSHILQLMPQNENWIENPVYRSVDEGLEQVQYYDSIMETDMTLWIKKDSLFTPETDATYDDSREETWQAWTKSGEYVLIRVRFTQVGDGRSMVCADWECDGTYYAISGEMREDADASPVAKTAVHIVEKLGESTISP